MQKPRPSSVIHVPDDGEASQPPPLPPPRFPPPATSLVAVVDPAMTHCPIIILLTSWSTGFCPLSQLRKEILDDKSISPEVQDYFFQLAGMNILRAARLLTLGIDTQKTAQIHLRH